MMQSITISSLLLLVAITNGQLNSTEPGGDPLYRICGLNYTQVENNCFNNNPTCPSGDRCPVGYTCYQLDETICPLPTPAPTPAATPATTTAPYSICAASFPEATTLCFDKTNNCATCNNATKACFTVRPDQCITDGGSIDAPTAPQAQTLTETPSVAPTAVPKITPSPSVSFAPTKAPTPNRFFCATSWLNVDENCNAATPCPNGQQDCANTAGTTCYQIQADKCASSSETEGPADQTNAPSASSSSATVPDKVRVCAKDPSEAALNCDVNTPCPDGSAAPCASGETCFLLVSCSASSAATGAPTPASGFSFETKPPIPSGVDQTTGSSTDSPGSSPSPPPSIPAYGFQWTTEPPNGSNMPNTSFFLTSVLVGASVLGAALAFYL